MAKKNKKAQIWFTDFAIAILIFSFVLIAYYTYTTNISKQDTIVLDELISDGSNIASTLTSSGYPDDWTVNNVVRVGFTDSNNKIVNKKFREFAKLDYNRSRRLIGAASDHFAFFFLNESGDVQNVEGYCGVGYPDIKFSYNIKAAYYYKNTDGETHLKSFMEDKFNADLYCDGGPKCPDLNRIDLNNNIANYGFVVVESPEWSTNQFDDFETAADPWVKDDGGLLMVGGRLPAGNKVDGFGISFQKESGDAEKNKIANVTNEDEFLNFKVDDNILFVQNYFVEDTGSIEPDFKEIALFNLTGNIALARWSNGEGNHFFFSDFDATYFSGDFIEEVEVAIRKWAGANCLPVDISSIERDALIKVDRLLIYNSELVKMVVYVWI